MEDKEEKHVPPDPFAAVSFPPFPTGAKAPFSKTSLFTSTVANGGGCGRVAFAPPLPLKPVTSITSDASEGAVSGPGPGAVPVGVMAGGGALPDASA